MPSSLTTAKQQGLINCYICGHLNPETKTECELCHSHLHMRKPASLQRTIAWLITSIILYLPANLLPIMHTVTFGRVESSTIIGGVITLWEYDSYFIATVIFVASVVVPIAKILVLIWLVLTVGFNAKAHHKERTILFRVTEWVGRWSMIDVFVVAILVALIQMGGILAIQPGIAALAFAGVVITTMQAAHAFDPRLIWDKYSEQEYCADDQRIN